MSASLPSPIDLPPSAPQVEFGRSSEDFPVAGIGDLVVAMLPGQGGHFLASAWRIQQPLSELKRDDFTSRSASIENEADFRARVSVHAEHCDELRMLDRKTLRMPCHTPWGPSQGATIYAEGVVSHTTASHGGFKLSPERNRRVHRTLRVEDGWYEEDSAWSILAITFPDLFTSYERGCAERTLKDRFPDAWETIFGTILAPGESHEKDRRAFDAAHGADWVVISAIRLDRHPGMTEVIATLGGKRAFGIEERRFLVPSDEYAVGRFGFVIDPDRHASYHGPSGFVGWSGRTA